RGRKAVLFCVDNEQVGRVSAGIDAGWSWLQRESERGAFDLFILCDTRDPQISAAEDAAWPALPRGHGAHGRVFYRRRHQNPGRKAGNIADFVRSWGGAYA